MKEPTDDTAVSTGNAADTVLAAAPLAQCPDADTWREWLCNSRDDDPIGRRSELAEHLDGCRLCRAGVDEVRRYQTLLLRGKAPALTVEQRASVEERVRLLAGSWTRPARVTPRLAWGLAVAIAVALVAALGHPLLTKQAESQRGFQERLEGARQTGGRGLGLTTGAVDGGIEVADTTGHWHALRPGDLLKGGLRVRAAAHGRIVVPGRFEVELAPRTEVDVLAMGAHDVWLRLRDGQVECQVEKLHAGQRFAVMFAGFRASVVGTRFVVQHPRGDGGVGVVVTEGAVRVDAADDPAQPQAETMTTVRAGNQWHFAGGRMALEPIRATPATAEQAAPTPEPATTSTTTGAMRPPSGHVHGTLVPPIPPVMASTLVVAAPPIAPSVPADRKQIVIEVPHQTMEPAVGQGAATAD
ncbi:MAG: hypothetical protein EXR79_01595 [Myxococcales bacterium]|nr:hypothetical protein [Myxococcales bacterium]